MRSTMFVPARLVPARDRRPHRLRATTRLLRILRSPRLTGPVRVARAVPLTGTIVVLALVATVLLRTHPADLDDVVAWSSTNIDNLSRHPVGSLVASAFVIPGRVLPELVLVTGGLLVLERTIGAWLALAVAAGGHVVATLLTEYGAELVSRLHLVAAAPDRSDVGISYLMFAVLGGAVVLRAGAFRLLGSVVLAAWAAEQFLLTPGMTSTGHLLSLGIGAGLTCWLGRASTARPVPAVARKPG